MVASHKRALRRNALDDPNKGRNPAAVALKQGGDAKGGAASSSSTASQVSRFRSQPLHQIDNADAQRIGDDLERLNRHVALSTLDFADVSAIQAGSVGKHILRPAPFEA